jgi:hypothetical protein
MTLRVLAVAPPQFPADPGESLALNSEDPASLFNACRLAALQAEAGSGVWGDSNWAEGRRQRRDSVLLLRSWDAAEEQLRYHLASLRPNLLLLGSMSICLPGAVACARLARDYLGDAVCIVLGGRHPTETIFTRGSQIVHHSARPSA